MDMKIQGTARARDGGRVGHRPRDRARFRCAKARVSSSATSTGKRSRRSRRATRSSARSYATSRNRRPSPSSSTAVDREARRPRCARQQRGHRRADRGVRRSRARRLAAHARRQPDRSVPVRAAGDSAAQGEHAIASIANLSSAAGRFGFPMRTPYAAAKWGVIGLTKSLSIELGPVRRPRQRDLPRLRRGPAHRAGLREQGGRARRHARRRARRGARQDVAAPVRHRRGHRERHRVSRLARRQQHFRARAAGRRRSAGADLTHKDLPWPTTRST